MQIIQKDLTILQESLRLLLKEVNTLISVCQASSSSTSLPSSNLSDLELKKQYIEKLQKRVTKCLLHEHTKAVFGSRYDCAERFYRNKL